jgi:hypothetical protein
LKIFFENRRNMKRKKEEEKIKIKIKKEKRIKITKEIYMLIILYIEKEEEKKNFSLIQKEYYEIYKEGNKEKFEKLFLENEEILFNVFYFEKKILNFESFLVLFIFF